MQHLAIDLLAEAIAQELAGTELGHCARVDFLERDQAQSICDTLSKRDGLAQTSFHILTRDRHQAANPRYITTDRAIEIRNRKTIRLCLFVPTDMVDAAFSSLANSFALIDGRFLYGKVLRQLLDRLPAQAQKIARDVFAYLRPPLRASDGQKLDFCSALEDRASKRELDLAGLELWRVGLIADGSPNFVANLGRNRTSAIKLALPLKIHAGATDRVESTRVDRSTASRLVSFFLARSMNDVFAWSRALAAGEGPTFDQWTFPQEDPSDITSVTLAPFIDREGLIQKYTKLAQPDGPGGSLIAKYGNAKDAVMVVKWATDPPKPRNLNRWRVELVPASDDADVDIDLPVHEVASHRRSLTVKLDLELESPPDGSFYVQVRPLDAAGETLRNAETNDDIVSLSQEFFLSPDIEIRPTNTQSTRRRTVPNIAFGRLETAIETSDTQFEEQEPLWVSRELEYFSLRLNQRRVITVGISPILRELERRVLNDPRSSGRFVVSAPEVRPASIDECEPLPLPTYISDTWNKFWQAREKFFDWITKFAPRDYIEVASWDQRLAKAAIQYAQTYKSLLSELQERQAPQEELSAALSIDTVLIRTAGERETPEEALVFLPTHPIRAAWMAGYTQLLQAWENEVLGRPARQRATAIDLATVRMLTPINVPAFGYHPQAHSPFAFFQNLRFFVGIALPPGVPDPQRRFADIAIILGDEANADVVGDLSPARLAEHIKAFYQLHAYNQSLVITLVNADQGSLVANAIARTLESMAQGDEEGEAVPLPTIRLQAYVEGQRSGGISGLNQIRQILAEHAISKGVSHLSPVISSTIQPVSALATHGPSDAHLAIVADFTQPSLTTAASKSTSDIVSSFSLYGLITRFIPEFSVTGDVLHWRYRIASGSVRSDPHPAGPRFAETLIDLQQSLLSAGRVILNGADGTMPVVEVQLDDRRRQMIEMLHARTNWVITLDRFFALDYYDSPRDQRLDSIARKYLIDYAPEFSDGLGHRMLITTGWRDEIESLLSRAMDDLGFARVDQSVSKLLHYLKTISGQLALRVAESHNSAAAAVGLGIVTAFLQAKGRLSQAVLVPVDSSPRIFSVSGSGATAEGERRCDLVLMSLKRNIVDATFIEVKWRRGSTPLESLATTMCVQMQSSADIVKARFFDPDRIDGSLQRAYLANVLRFYFERARRYGLLAVEVETPFLEHLAKLEKAGLEFRASYEGYIVSLDEPPRRPFMIRDTRITVLTAHDIEQMSEFGTVPGSAGVDSEADTVGVEAMSSQDQGTSEGDTTGEEPSAQTATPQPSAIPEPEGATQQPAITADPPAGPAIEVPPPPPQDIVVELGETAAGRVDWKPSVKGSPHLFIIGIPGQGKSWTTTRILTRLGEQRIPALVLDFHGQFADPSGPFAQRVGATTIDAAEGLPFSPFESITTNGKNDWKINSQGVAEIFSYIVGLGGIQRDALYNAILDAYKARGFSIGDTTGLTYPTPSDVLRFIERRERDRRVSNISARCRPLLEMDLFKPEGDHPDLLRMVHHGLVIDLHNLHSEVLQMTAGAFVLRKIYRDMFTWRPADHIRLAIVLDEAHRLAKDVTLPKIMKEGRKFGISVIVASQGMNDFHADVLGNAGTKVLFRTNYPDSKKIANYIRGRQGEDLVSQIEQLGVGTSYVQTAEMPQGAVVKMYPPE